MSPVEAHPGFGSPLSSYTQAARDRLSGQFYKGGSAVDKKDKAQKKEVPFFARYLEGQGFPRVKSDVKAGPKPPFQTLKYPSDDDEEGWVWPWP